MATRLVRFPAILAVAGLLLACIACERPRPSGPNLLLVTIDTLRADALECYGGEEGVGREICALADRGIRHGWAFSTSSSTSPAIASVLTSRYPHEHGVLQFATSLLSDDAVTLAEVLNDAGYATAAFVSNPVLVASRQMDQGFDLYDDEMSLEERNRPGNRERLAEATTDAALAWIAEADRPWFVWVHFQDPHGPYEAPGAAVPVDDPADRRLARLRDHSGKGGIPAYQRIPGVFTLPAYQRGYLDEVRYVDAHVGRLIRAADSGDAPVAILLTSDHGEAFGEDGYFLAHGHSLGLDQIRVPLIWRPAGGAPPSRSPVPASLVDVAPTLLAAAGVESPEVFRGRNLGSPDADDLGTRVIFAEQRLRAAVVSGGAYYARDREEITAPTQDRISGGTVRPLPTRHARLGSADALPGYEVADPAGDAHALVRVLDEFIERTPSSPEPPRAELPDETRMQLEALGYLE